MKLLFAGTPAFAAGYLESLVDSGHALQAVITQPDRPGKRGSKLLPSPVKALALQHGLPVIQPDKLKLAHLQDYPCDLMIVVAYGQILRQPVLDYPRLGCINVHASLLPRWRGAAPVQRAILAGDRETGVTLMQMDAGLDTGDMLAKAAFPITGDDTAATVFDKLGKAGQPLLLQLLDQLEKDSVTPEPQDDGGATYANKLDKNEARIDWHRSADEIDRQVRAFQPDPVAWCELGDMRVRVHKGRPAEGKYGVPGEVMHVAKKGITIACGNGHYLIERIQLPVGKGAVMSAADVLNGRKDIIHAGVWLT